MHIFRVTIYSHYFKVDQLQPRAHGCIMNFCKKYAIKQWIKERGKAFLKITKVFATKTKNNREFRFHIGQYEDFLRALKDDYITESMYIVESVPLYEPSMIDIKVQPQWVLREHQLQAQAFILEHSQDDNRSRLVAMQTGSGKLQPLDAKIKVPNGWSTMGEMHVGTEVIAKDGSITKVTGVYPQGVTSVFRVTFGDDRSTECGLDHLWKVYIDTKETIITTQDIESLLVSNKLYIDLCDSEQNADIELPIDPYTLGKYIDQYNNTIPKEYFNGSTQQRSALLKGLTSDAPLYVTLNEQLALDVQYLVRSLGGIAQIVINKLEYIIYIEYSSKLRIESVEPIGYDETQCISIDHPEQLYITDDFIVTHNTVTALITTSKLHHRTMIMVLSGYVDKWIADVEKTIDIDPGDIIVIQGSQSLKNLTYSEPSAKFIIVSLNTIKNYFKAYEEHPTDMEALGYAYPPEELCERLDIGNIIIDEVHQHLHAVYKLLTYTHVPKVIALSATLISDDPIIKIVQQRMFPKEIRFDKIKFDQYIHCYSMSYFFNDMNKEKIRTTEFGSKNYSHNAFEKSLMRRHNVLMNYYKMIDNMIRLGYLEQYQRGDKLAIYVSSIAMAESLTNWLKQKYPDLDIRRYVEQDPYENVIDADIRVTTVLSAGTAIDIPNLTTVIMTINMKSSVFNLQTLGRLRKIEGRDVKFYYIFNQQIPKHHEYHKHRMEIFSDRVESIKELHYPYGI